MGVVSTTHCKPTFFFLVGISNDKRRYPHNAERTLQAPATSEQSKQVKQKLDLARPADLDKALLISNGLSIGDPEEYFANITDFSIDQILSDTLHFRL